MLEATQAPKHNVSQVVQVNRGSEMRSVAERMRAMRNKRRGNNMREVRLTVPDARSATVRARLAEQIARLDPADEEEAMRWIEAVSEFDNDETR